MPNEMGFRRRLGLVLTMVGLSCVIADQSKEILSLIIFAIGIAMFLL